MLMRFAMAAMACVVAAPLALAQDNGSKADEKAAPVGEPKVFVSEHQGRFNGELVRYTATAGETFLKNDKDEPTAAIFSTTYLRQGTKDTTQRPVIFIFNGGPGSASLWLHMGVFGPKRINLPSDARDDGAPPYEIVDNVLSPLDIADLVFIDPVGTGFSRAIGKGKDKDFWGIKQDTDSIAEFVRLWITENKRWNSPKYVAGESYGTTRAAALAERLQGGFNGIAVNGVILISAILDFQSTRFAPGNQIPFISFLPSYAATNWYHHLKGQTDVTLADHVERTRRFAIDVYAPALLKGNRLSADEHKAVRDELAALTGLSERYLDDADLRVSMARFAKEFGRAEGFTVGRFDSRFKGKDFDNAGERYDNDPSGYAIAGGFTAAINQYMASDLDVNIEREYKVLSSTPGRNWDWSGGEPVRGYSNVNVANGLGMAMRENSDLRVMLASGYYDLATPFFASENTMATNGIVAERLTKTYYEAGHMMYLHQPSLEKLTSDVRDFVLAGEKARSAGGQ